MGKHRNAFSRAVLMRRGSANEGLYSVFNAVN